MLQMWQAYHRYQLTNNEGWKDAVEKAWTDYKEEWEAENPGVAPKKKRFEITNEFVRRKLDEEGPEKLKEVDECRKNLKYNVEGDANTNAKYQEYVLGMSKLWSALSLILHI